MSSRFAPSPTGYLHLGGARTALYAWLWAKQNNKNKNKYNNFSLRILVSLDAKLAETISYQGERAIPSFLKQTNIQSKDEKYQQNRFLTEWLESIFSLGILPKKNIKNILDKNA